MFIHRMVPFVFETDLGRLSQVAERVDELAEPDRSGRPDPQRRSAFPLQVVRRGPTVRRRGVVGELAIDRNRLAGGVAGGRRPVDVELPQREHLFRQGKPQPCLRQVREPFGQLLGVLQRLAAGAVGGVHPTQPLVGAGEVMGDCVLVDQAGLATLLLGLHENQPLGLADHIDRLLHPTDPPEGIGVRHHRREQTAEHLVGIDAFARLDSLTRFMFTRLSFDRFDRFDRFVVGRGRRAVHPAGLGQTRLKPFDRLPIADLGRIVGAVLLGHLAPLHVPLDLQLLRLGVAARLGDRGERLPNLVEKLLPGPLRAGQFGKLLVDVLQQRADQVLSLAQTLPGQIGLAVGFGAGHAGSALGGDRGPMLPLRADQSLLGPMPLKRDPNRPRQKRDHQPGRDRRDERVSPDALHRAIDPPGRPRADRLARGDPLQLIGQLSGRAEAVAGQLLQTRHDDEFEIPRNVRLQFADRHRRRVRHTIQHLLHFADERLHPGEQFVQQHPERVHVGPRADPRVGQAGLLRGHVGRRAGEHLHLVGRDRPDRSGHSEVGQVDALLVEQNVGRLDVPMDDLVAVGMLDRLGQTADQGDRVVDAERRLRGRIVQLHLQRRAVDPLGYDVDLLGRAHERLPRHAVGRGRRPRRLANLQHRHDRLVTQLRRGPRLGQEPLPLSRVAVEAGGDFDRDLPLQLQVDRLPDPPERAAA